MNSKPTSNVDPIPAAVLLLIFAGTCCFAAPGCASGAGPAAPKPAAPEAAAKAAAGTWSLVSLNGADLIAPGGVPGRGGTPWFTLSPDGALSGFIAVNRFSTRLDLAALAPGQFRVGPMATTRMAGPPEQMKLEADFLEAFGKVDRFEAHADTLTLSGDAGTALVFHRVKNQQPEPVR